MATSRSLQGAAALRAAIKAGDTLIALGAHDALSAALVERYGFDVAYVGSYTTEAAVHLHPDVGLMSKSDRQNIVASIANAVSVPVFADIEEGYGGPIVVASAIRDFEAAGAAMVHIDDQTNPGICPYLPGVPPVTLIESQEMCAKIEAAVAAREGDMLIVARSDVTGHVRDGAYTDEQREEVIRRSNDYLSAGADAILIGTFTTDDIYSFADRIHGPLIGLFEDALPHSVSAFREAGYFLVLGPTLLLFAAIKGMTAALEAFKESFDWNSTLAHRVTADEFYEIIGWSRYQDLLGKYATSAAPAR
jgi:2-methylisocitrate lyase-like PEP mutase family enzyme